MMPTICKIGPFTIFSYGLMLAVAFTVATFLAAREARKQGRDPEIITNLFFWVFISGIIGCRVFYIFQNLKFYLASPLEIIQLQHGGLSWFGGLIFGSITALAYLKLKKLPILKTLDLIIPFVALGQTIGRVGCFLNGCCYGKLTKLGVYFSSLEQARIPTQIYSSLLLLAIFLALRYLQKRGHKPGIIFAAYLFLYSIKRFFIEFLRDTDPVVFAGLTIFQILCIAVFFISLLLFYWINKKSRQGVTK